MKLQPAADYRALRRDPVGRYALMDRFGAWGLRPDLCGWVMWGRPQREDVEALFIGFDEPSAPTLVLPCDVVFDLRRVVGIDPETFDYFLEGSQARLPVFAERIRRQAIVRPSGLLGAAAEGFGALIGPRYGWAVFESLPAALEWVGVPEAADLAQQLDQLVDVATAGSLLVARLRSWLAASTGRVTLEEAAQALGTSTRSLQRSLGEAATSFSQEFDGARLEKAKQLLLDSELKLDAIAVKVGCSSLGSFGSFFRRMTGTSPSEFRARKGG